MLTQLTIANFAIIQQTDLGFSPHFNVITGETGAGKSILLGALSLILGERANLASKSNDAAKTVVEATFRLNESYQSFFAEHDLDFDSHTIIRRELLASGKSRAFINDTPTNLSVLQALSRQLIDVHQQHDTMRITNLGFQRMVLDVFANCDHLVKEYHQEYVKVQQLQKLIEKKRNEEIAQQQKKDFLQFQFDELDQLSIKQGELEESEQELTEMQSAEQILEAKNSLEQMLEDEGGLMEQLRQISSIVRSLSNTTAQFSSLQERFESVLLEMEDVLQEIQHTEVVELDEERMQQLQHRLNEINRMFNKHHVQSEEELSELYEQIETELTSIEGMRDDILQLEAQLTKIQAGLIPIANEIHEKRLAAIPSFEQGMEDLLAEVGLEQSKFLVLFQESDSLGPYGKDEIEFQFSANKGRLPKSLRQVASGGELSRIMLAISSMVAEKSDLPTLIFDEIDTGISGEVAKKVGKLLQHLSQHHQVISITHSPQVAAKADAHFKVFKVNEEGQTLSMVERLREENRVLELAEMLSGQNPSETSIQTAKELMS